MKYIQTKKWIGLSLNRIRTSHRSHHDDGSLYERESPDLSEAAERNREKKVSGLLIKGHKRSMPCSADTSAFKQTRFAVCCRCRCLCCCCRPTHKKRKEDTSQIRSMEISKDRVVRLKRNHVREKSIMGTDAEN